MSAADLVDLDELAGSLHKRSNQLRDMDKIFSGYQDDPPNGEFHPGTALHYREALDAALLEIVASYEDKGQRPPAEDVRTARARQKVKREDPELYERYHIQQATIERLKRWLTINRDAISAKQSVLRTERELAGNPPPQRTRGHTYGARAA